MMLHWMIGLFLLVSAAAFGQGRTPIAVGCDCTDHVGAMYATELKEQIARSSRLSLVAGGGARTVAATQGNAGYTLDIISVGMGDGQTAALSVALTARGVFLGHVVQTCKRTQVEECARRTIAAMDGELATVARR